MALNEQNINLPEDMKNFRPGFDLESVHKLNLSAKQVKEGLSVNAHVISNEDGSKNIEILDKKDKSSLAKFENVRTTLVNENEV